MRLQRNCNIGRRLAKCRGLFPKPFTRTGISYAQLQCRQSRNGQRIQFFQKVGLMSTSRVKISSRPISMHIDRITF